MLPRPGIGGIAQSRNLYVPQLLLQFMNSMPVMIGGDVAV